MVTKIQEFSNSDILITIPKSIKWENYTKELINAENGDIMNFKVPFLPKSSIIGNKCYVVYNGFIRGYMIISGVIPSDIAANTWSLNLSKEQVNFII